jgi:pimeloyl-ACP methyl ester carboxylesterase
MLSRINTTVPESRNVCYRAAVDLHHALTRDGCRIALHRLGGAASDKRRHPVLCCHGLGANRLAFDVDTDVSLARHLAARGYEVFLLELRGHGASERPPYGWSFDDYLLADLPAAIAHVKKVAGADRVHWIGHSMGGVLAFAHLSLGGSADFCSAITVGSAADYSQSKSGFHTLMPIVRVLDMLPSVPVGAIARLSGHFVQRFTTPYETFNVAPGNCDLRLWKRICEDGFHPVSPPVMKQLGSAMQSGGLRSRDGSVSYVDGLASASAPLLALAGTHDLQCPPDATERTVQHMGNNAEVRVFAGYGHFDMLIGSRVHDDVFPLIGAWLDRHDVTKYEDPDPHATVSGADETVHR